MASFAQEAASRRKFLQFLAASPLLAAGGARAGDAPTPGAKPPDPLMWAPMRADEPIKSPKEAINVFDFEPVCRNNVPPAHFGYMASGIDDEVTLRANREGFLKFQLIQAAAMQERFQSRGRDYSVRLLYLTSTKIQKRSWDTQSLQAFELDQLL